MLQVKYLLIIGVSITLIGCQPLKSDAKHLDTTTNSNIRIPWAKAKEGQTRYMIELTQKDDVDNYEVELIVGKNVEVDNCNQFHFMGTLEKKSLQGWGYDYYVANPTVIVGTKRACLNDKKVKKSIQMYDRKNMRLRYNTKLPIVVYVPNDFTVSYILWKKEKKIYQATAK